MPEYYRYSDPDFWEQVTPEPLRFISEVAGRFGYGTGTIVMSDNSVDASAPAVSLLYIPPGGVLPRHAHPCFRVEVMVRGTLEVGNGQVLHPGDVMVSQPGKFYGPHVAGPDGSLSAEIFSTAAGIETLPDPQLEEEFVEKIQHANTMIKDRFGL
jgi:hypothetical protein